MSNQFGEKFVQCGLEVAQVVILPVPWEDSTSYGTGTAKGPEAILKASPYLEFYDEQFDNEPWRVGIHTADPVVPVGDPEEMMEHIHTRVAHYIERDKFVIVLGGEHSVTNGVFRAFNRSVDDLWTIQFDAHSDLREAYEGNPYSHASVMRRIWDMNRQIVQIGVRSQCKEERDFIVENHINTKYAHNIRETSLNGDLLSGTGENIFITFDVDFFDPSIMPATGTPEPGGFYWDETINFLNLIIKNKNLCGMDIVELSPIQNRKDPDFMIAKLIYKIIGLLALHGRFDATR